MTAPAEYRALADRVEAGADIQLMIVRAVEAIKQSPGPWEDFSPMVTMYWRAGAYLDAVEALRVAKLPGWRFSVVKYPDHWMARFISFELRKIIPANAPTEPAARLAALLRAMAAQMEADDAGN